MKRLALIAGQGDLPSAVLAALQVPPLVCALDGFAPKIAVDQVFRLERLALFLRYLQDGGVGEVIFAGAVQRPNLDPSLFDPQTAQMVPRLLAALGAGDDGALRVVIEIFEEHGFSVRGVSDIAPDLISYMNRYTGKDTPKSICPFALELIHNPEIETDPIASDAPILSRRRNFRANANYSKPCIMRRDLDFTIGGHANNHLPRYLDPHLYLLHLRFFDYDITCERLGERRALREIMTGDKDPASVGHAWSKDLINFKIQF